MNRNILDLKMGDDSYMIEDKDLGNPLFFIHEQTKNLSNPEFYRWIAELHFLKLTDEKRGLFDSFQKSNPKMVQPNFLSQLEILAFNLYNDYYYDEIKGELGKDKLKELSMKSQEVMAERINELEKLFNLKKICG